MYQHCFVYRHRTHMLLHKQTRAHAGCMDWARLINDRKYNLQLCCSEKMSPHKTFCSLVQRALFSAFISHKPTIMGQRNKKRTFHTLIQKRTFQEEGRAEREEKRRFFVIWLNLLGSLYSETGHKIKFRKWMINERQHAFLHETKIKINTKHKTASHEMNDDEQNIG